MIALCLPWLARCGLWMVVLLTGCAAVPPPPVAPLLHDALFQHPPRPADADTVLALSPAMQAHVDRLRAEVPLGGDLAMALAKSLYSPGGLQLDYDATFTRNAAAAFAARSGNCLSLAVMTTALARALGLEVDFRAVRGEDLFRREGTLMLRSGHVNLLLAKRAESTGWSGRITEPPMWHVVIDFLPQESARALPSDPISQDQVLAMFMNNRAVESLLAGAPADAYAWVREALRHDPASASALNTLGVVYQRAGHLAEAAAAYEQGLVLNDRQLAAMANLSQVRRAQGREDEARAWEARRAALEPHPPFHFLQLGLAALDRGDLAQARAQFQRELRRQPDAHEAWLGLARVHLALGEHDRAEQALRRALGASATVGEQARFAGKLAALKAAAH